MEEKEIFVKQINVFEILSRIIEHRKIYLKYCFIFGILGLSIAFLTPKKYSASVVLAPELNSEGLGNTLSSLASMAGFDLGDAESQEAIHLNIYPDVIVSTEFIEELLAVPVTMQDGTRISSFEEYLMGHQHTTPWNYPIMMLKKYISETLSNDNNNIVSTSTNEPKDYIQYSKKRYMLIDDVKDLVSCDIDKENGLISISVSCQDPVVCASVSADAQKILQKYIINYRTKKATVDVEYYKTLKEQTYNEYLSLQNRYAKMADANQDVNLYSLKSRIETLENEMHYQFNAYTQISAQLDIARNKLQERTPSFVVIQPSVVPIKADSPKKMIVTFVWIIIGFMVASMKVFGKDMLAKLKSELTKKS